MKAICNPNFQYTPYTFLVMVLLTIICLPRLGFNMIVEFRVDPGLTVLSPGVIISDSATTFLNFPLLNMHTSTCWMAHTCDGKTLLVRNVFINICYLVFTIKKINVISTRQSFPCRISHSFPFKEF